MNDILLKLKQTGQILSKELADCCGVSERSVNQTLYPHIAAGRVMACKVIGPDMTCLGTEYRLAGTHPRCRPGPKVGGATNMEA